MPGAPSSFLAPGSKARSPVRRVRSLLGKEMDQLNHFEFNHFDLLTEICTLVCPNRVFSEPAGVSSNTWIIGHHQTVSTATKRN